MVNRRPSASFTLEGPGSIIRTAIDEVVVVLSGILRIFEILQEIETVI
jgi:hypothetical protein